MREYVDLYKDDVFQDRWYVEDNETVLDVISEAISKGHNGFKIGREE